MQSNIEVTINDRDWPNMILVVKSGLQVETKKVRFDADVADSFSSIVSKFVQQAVQAAIQKRGSNGT